MKAKTMSNLFKVLIVLFIFFNYIYQSKISGAPLTSDQARGLLYIGLAGFLILSPVDASIFIKNWKEVNKVKKDIEETTNEND